METLLHLGWLLPPSPGRCSPANSGVHYRSGAVYGKALPGGLLPPGGLPQHADASDAPNMMTDQSQ